MLIFNRNEKGEKGLHYGFLSFIDNEQPPQKYMEEK